MTSRDFCFWLQGGAELVGEAPTADQWKVIKAHLNLLSKLSLGLRSHSFASIIANTGSREDIFQEAGRLDATLGTVHSKEKNQVK